MSFPGELIREARLAAGLSQRALATRAGTSQSAIARYESGATAPSWETLRRLIEACGKRLRVGIEVAPDPEDVELARRQLDLEPLQRLRALRSFVHLRGSAVQ